MDKDLKKLEQLYIKWKNAYYSGNPLVPDADFDNLEEILIEMGSNIIKVVGSLDNQKSKYTHPTKMLSLAKIKTKDNTKPPVDDFLKWISKIGKYSIECSPKYDGNAANIIYENGNLQRAITRGDGFCGQDITSKLFRQIPNHINTDKKIVEIRGEVVIEINTFEKKYKFYKEKEYKNPRNFVAGILNQLDTENTILDDLRFIPFEIKEDDGTDISYILDTKQELIRLGFTNLPYIKKITELTTDSFIKVFNHFLDYRKNVSIYQLDGFVLKILDSNKRIELGENDHEPEWALAVKFEPKEVSTYIESIEWKLGKTGEFTPVGNLTPVDLDGSTVSRVSLYNYGAVLNRNTLPGAKISLVKSGDIIPMILEVLEPSTETIDDYLITECPACRQSLIIENSLHLICNNPNCIGQKLSKFRAGINQLQLDFFGEKLIEKIYMAGITNPFEILDPIKFNRRFLINAGLPDGVMIDKILHQVRKITEIELQTIILIMGVSNLGRATAVEIAKFVSGQKYTTYGLQNEFFELFKPGHSIRNELNNILKLLFTLNIMVKLPTQLAADVKLYECTGSPKPWFKSKEEFDIFMEQHKFVHSKLDKNAHYLITDSYTSTSGKMKKAIDLKVKIITYEDILKLVSK
jgi:DNA ligase (NAD+)